MLALVWAIQKIRLYLAGSKFKVVTSHQPLVAICNGKNLDAINNMWIQRLLAETMGYEFRVLWTDGKYNWIADALSRSPVFAAEPNDTELVCTVKTTQIFKTSQETNSSYDPALQKIIDIAEEDADYQQCYEDIKKKLVDLPRDHPGQKLSSIWSALSIGDDLPGLLLYHGRIFAKGCRVSAQDATHPTFWSQKNTQKRKVQVLLAQDGGPNQANGFRM